ncbi:pentapeptide repeat-containing protein [Nocardioides conyzicola]|uniref:Pentapeptide repeat-containing protein n=1 Tax=Nocardioides conyzicola TaxID=1651781 RepID=A0ABP8X9Y7_9ACTN
MAASPTKSPQITPLDLGRLVDGDPSELRDGAYVESARFADLVLPHLALAGAELVAARFQGLSADEADLKGARLSEVELDQVDVPVVRAARSQWRDVRVTGRIGSLEAYEAELRSVHFVGCKLSYVNLRGAELLDVAFTDCVIEELDLIQGKARRVRFSGTRIAQLDVQQSELHDVDLRGAELEGVTGVAHLRGATFSPHQLDRLAPLLALEIGIKIEA